MSVAAVVKIKTVEPNEEAGKRAASQFVVIRPLRHQRPLCFKQNHQRLCECVRAGRPCGESAHTQYFLAGWRVHVTWSCVCLLPPLPRV